MAFSFACSASAPAPLEADVLVVGAGIAGVTAAFSAAAFAKSEVYAAERGIDVKRGAEKPRAARVLLAAQGGLFSGSSFFPGTWGLGLVGPESPEDETDLERAILEVGCGMADPALVRTFVRGIAPAIERLERLGAQLKRPDHAGEREFIPCFDRKHRLWRGILREPFERAMRSALQDAGVHVLDACELVDLEEAEGLPGIPCKDRPGSPCQDRSASPVVRNGKEDSKTCPPCGKTPEPPSAGTGAACGDGPRAISGAVLFDHANARFLRVDCSALVLACGGFGGLFERRLTGADVTGAAHAIALRHGARLVNLEFMQMMPGLVRPVHGVVFNEKAFRFMEFEDSPAARPFADRPDAQALLDERSGYGPFTSRLASRAVDAAIDAAGAAGLAARYRLPEGFDGAPGAAAEEALLASLPELVRDYCAWLEKASGVRPRDWIRLALHAHAANGGVLVDEHAWTGVPGLFACGEMTGGMHGADRIGGLSSSNGLVFGRIAGESAARRAAALARRGAAPATAAPSFPRAGESADSLHDPGAVQAQVGEMRAEMQRAMSAHCMVARTEAGLSQALAEIERLSACTDALLTSHGGMDSSQQAGSPTAGNAEVPAGKTAAEPESGAKPSEPARALADALRLRSQLQTARAVVTAMLARRESRGAHFRADFPRQDPAFDRPFVFSREDF